MASVEACSDSRLVKLATSAIVARGRLPLPHGRFHMAHFCCTFGDRMKGLLADYITVTRVFRRNEKGLKRESASDSLTATVCS